MNTVVGRTPGADRPSGRRQRVAALVALLLLAAGLRFWGIDHEVWTDENKVIGPALALARGQGEPRFYPRGSYYPHLSHYLLGVVFWPRVRGGLPLSDTVSHTLARLPMAAIAVLTVGVVFLVGRRLAGTSVGLLASLLLAVAPLHVKYAHYAHVEIPATFLMLLAWGAALRLWDEGRMRWYLASGLLTGLAGAAQYWGLTVGAALLLSHGARVLATRQGLRGVLSRPLIAGLLAVPVGFFLGSPYTILAWRESLAQYQKLNQRALGGDLGYTRPDLLWPLLTASPDWGVPFTAAGLARELPPLVFLLAAVGVLFASRRRDWRVLVLCGVVSLVLYLAIVGYVRLYAVKRLLPLTPFLALLAAYALIVVGRLRTQPLLLARVAQLALLAAAVGPALRADASFAAAYAGGSTHSSASRWARGNLPAGSTLLQPGPLRLLAQEEFSGQLLGMGEVYANLGRGSRQVAEHRARSLADWLAAGADFVVLDYRMVGRYSDPTAVRMYPEHTASYRAFYDEIRARGTLVYRIEPVPWKQAGPRIEIYDVRALRDAG